MELHQWAPWVLSALGMVHPRLLGDRKRSGWLWAAATCLITLVYNIITEQYGFVPVLTVVAWTSIRNYRKWSTGPTLEEHDQAPC